MDRVTRKHALKRWPGFLWRAASLLMLPPLAGAGAYAWSADQSYVGVLGEFKSGKFGTDNGTDLYALHLEYGAFGQDYDGSINFSYLSLRDDYAGTDSGIGDVLLRAGYKLSTEPKSAFASALGIAIKLPTADEDKGLGTGATDLGFNIGISKQLTAVKVGLDLGYVLVGDPKGIDYENSLQYGVSAFRGWTQLGMYVSLNGRTAMVRDATNPLELDIGGFYLLTPGLAVTANGLLGLNDGSPDYGLALGFTVWL